MLLFFAGTFHRFSLLVLVSLGGAHTSRLYFILAESSVKSCRVAGIPAV